MATTLYRRQGQQLQIKGTRLPYILLMHRFTVPSVKSPQDYPGMDGQEATITGYQLGYGVNPACASKGTGASLTCVPAWDANSELELELEQAPLGLSAQL